MKLRIRPPGDDNKELQRFFREACRLMSKTQPGSVTLAASAGSTVVADINVRTDSRIMLFPTSANAAADLGSGAMYVSAKTQGVSFTITHPNNANADKTFDYAIFN